MKKSEKEILNKSIIRSALLLVSVFSFMIGTLITIESLTKNKEKKEQLITYDTIGKVDYKINLIENDLYDSFVLTTENIISKYIDTIEVDFNYEMFASKKLDSNAKYNIKATVVNTYEKKGKQEEFFSKEVDVIPKYTKHETNTNFIHHERVMIDYNYYNNIAQSVRENSGILTNSYLKIEFKVENDLMLTNTKELFFDNHKITLIVPLLENITSITQNGEFENKETLYSIIQVEMNYAQLIIGILLLGVSACFMYSAVKMFLDISNISQYIKEKNKILRRYGDIIAETSTKPELRGLEVMEITNIIDLVNIEDELRIPIIFYEAIKDKEAWFIIIHNDKVYRYLLKKKNKQQTKK